MSKTIAKANVLWIEANPVFGGSLSQVQFPAELSPFFRLPSRPTIGDFELRAVICAAVPFPAKKMDFHHNDVWRLNLPTTNQGLGGYRHRLLVFERTDDPATYRLSLVDPKGPLAKRLRGLSRSQGKLGSKRRDDRTKREYGYF